MADSRDMLQDVSLCWLTLARAGHAELVEVAGAAGFGHVSMRLVARPRPGESTLPDARQMAAIRHALKQTGVRIVNVGGLGVSADFRPADLEPSLALAAELGGTHLIVVGLDPDPSRLFDNVSALAELAWRHGVGALVEFAAYTAIRTFADATAMVKALGRPEVRVLFDALHYQRSGGTVADLEGHPTEGIGLFHLCDAPLIPPEDLWTESAADRLWPGQGALPLVELLTLMPSHVRLEVEAPCRRFSDRPVREQARMVAHETRRVLARRGRAASGHDPMKGRQT